MESSKTQSAEHELRVSKTARYYTLGALNQDTRDVWLVCHGYAQLASRFILQFESIVTPQRAVIAPEGLHRFYLDAIDRKASDRRVGATWMTREARDADIADYVAFLDQVCAAELRHGEIRLTALGFSQGVATVARWAALGQTNVQRLVFWGAALPPDLDWARAGPRFETADVVLVAGERDELWSSEHIREEEKRLSGHAVPFRTLYHPGGHHIHPAGLEQLIDNETKGVR
jgi:predicted esterase